MPYTPVEERRTPQTPVLRTPTRTLRSGCSDGDWASPTPARPPDAGTPLAPYMVTLDAFDGEMPVGESVSLPIPATEKRSLDGSALSDAELFAAAADKGAPPRPLRQQQQQQQQLPQQGHKSAALAQTHRALARQRESEQREAELRRELERVTSQRDDALKRAEALADDAARTPQRSPRAGDENSASVCSREVSLRYVLEEQEHVTRERVEAAARAAWFACLRRGIEARADSDALALATNLRRSLHHSGLFSADAAPLRRCAASSTPPDSDDSLLATVPQAAPGPQYSPVLTWSEHTCATPTGTPHVAAAYEAQQRAVLTEGAEAIRAALQQCSTCSPVRRLPWFDSPNTSPSPAVPTPRMDGSAVFSAVSPSLAATVTPRRDDGFAVRNEARRDRSTSYTPSPMSRSTAVCTPAGEAVDEPRRLLVSGETRRRSQLQSSLAEQLAVLEAAQMAIACGAREARTATALAAVLQLGALSASEARERAFLCTTSDRVADALQREVRTLVSRNTRSQVRALEVDLCCGKEEAARGDVLLSEAEQWCGLELLDERARAAATAHSLEAAAVMSVRLEAAEVRAAELLQRATSGARHAAGLTCAASAAALEAAEADRRRLLSVDAFAVTADCLRCWVRPAEQLVPLMRQELEQVRAAASQAGARCAELSSRLLQVEEERDWLASRAEQTEDGALGCAEQAARGGNVVAEADARGVAASAFAAKVAELGRRAGRVRLDETVVELEEQLQEELDKAEAERCKFRQRVEELREAADAEYTRRERDAQRIAELEERVQELAADAEGDSVCSSAGRYTEWLEARVREQAEAGARVQELEEAAERDREERASLEARARDAERDAAQARAEAAAERARSDSLRELVEAASEDRQQPANATPPHQGGAVDAVTARELRALRRLVEEHAEEAATLVADAKKREDVLRDQAGEMRLLSVELEVERNRRLEVELERDARTEPAERGRLKRVRTVLRERETENRVLRHRLQQAHRRLLELGAELPQGPPGELRPLLAAASLSPAASSDCLLPSARGRSVTTSQTPTRQLDLDLSPTPASLAAAGPRRGCSASGDSQSRLQDGVKLLARSVGMDPGSSVEGIVRGATEFIGAVTAELKAEAAARDQLIEDMQAGARLTSKLHSERREFIGKLAGARRDWCAALQPLAEALGEDVPSETAAAAGLCALASGRLSELKTERSRLQARVATLRRHRSTSHGGRSSSRSGGREADELDPGGLRSGIEDLACVLGVRDEMPAARVVAAATRRLERLRDSTVGQLDARCDAAADAVRDMEERSRRLEAENASLSLALDTGEQVEVTHRQEEADDRSPEPRDSHREMRRRQQAARIAMRALEADERARRAAVVEAEYGQRMAKRSNLRRGPLLPPPSPPPVVRQLGPGGRARAPHAPSCSCDCCLGDLAGDGKELMRSARRLHDEAEAARLRSEVQFPKPQPPPSPPSAAETDSRTHVPDAYPWLRAPGWLSLLGDS
eukprot:TRINITY_DN1459_c0_g1_i1.p1 TRINITY_DN1459_c0_g1~~TRINITY_DN1459_c0_g1_i1.p1  ORF type:complete len:1509 (+),score=420.68 TRINITY_DN1459_c0_g1_i1:56-4528(+)